MSTRNPLLARWGAGQPTLGAWMATGDPQVAEILASAGFDSVCVDQQHGLADGVMIGDIFRAIETYGVVPITRVLANDAGSIGRALDRGALAVIVPMVNSGAEAARAISACHYPPRGQRSSGPMRGVIARTTARLEQLDDVACLVMVETADGLREVDAIAATPGLDGIYVGPRDLAIGLGLPAQSEDRSESEARIHADAVEEIRAACRRHGIAPGIHCYDGQTAAGYLEQGFLMVTVTTDARLLADGSRQQLAIARAKVHR
jgi:4-hydroxy-2-oxoheptanedioate aldolase